MASERDNDRDIKLYIDDIEQVRNRYNIPNSEILSDIDGNVYQTLQIGNQTWMAENLKVTRYRNRDPILNVKDGEIWEEISEGAYCNYDNDPNNTPIHSQNNHNDIFITYLT